MIANDDTSYTIDQLSNEVVRLLKANQLFGNHQDNRVSAAPDMRTIRYYATLGLVDRPLVEGRVAKYNNRHLLQLLAVKTLQLHAMPLSEVQEKLYGLSDSELQAVIESYSPRASDSQARLEQESFHTVVWREILLEPGLKIVAEKSWTTCDDLARLEQKIRAALESLQNQA